jgi:ferredoxin/flavodoxin---NADP+ reductase
VKALRVAIVGSGPAGAYAAGHLLAHGDAVEVEMLDRLPTPWGLVRAGVAPDHQRTKGVTRTFEWSAGAPNFGFHLNVEVGRHLSHEELLAHHHAVIYAVGAPDDRHLGIAGEDLPGSHAATAFVAWYNGHPDFRDASFDLSGERAVIVGNGNVALDVARILSLGVDDLRRTDVADHALEALSRSRIEEVVVLGRRGPAQAAFTSPELLALSHVADVDVVVDPAHAEPDEHSAAWLRNGAPFGARLKTRLIRELARCPPCGAAKRIVLRFLGSPTAIVGDDRVERLAIARNGIVKSDRGLSARPTGETEVIDAGLVLRSVGYRGRQLDTVPFDQQTATIPNQGGRVLDDSGAVAPGVYTTGWIKRGPSGVIGTNKQCSRETVRALLDDHASDRLPEPLEDGAALRRLISERRPAAVDRRGWAAIDAHELEAGRRTGRPRVKVTDVEEMLEIAIA